jgi:hypothetical protein
MLSVEIAIHPVVGVKQSVSPIEDRVVEESSDEKVGKDLAETGKVARAINSLRSCVGE